MSVFVDSDVEIIDINDVTWSIRVNENFKRFSSVEQITFTSSNAYTISDSTYTMVAQYSHRTFFVDTSSGTADCTITLPDPASNINKGKELIFIRKDGTAPDTVGQKILFAVSGSTTLQGASGKTDMEKKAGLRMVITSDGTKWYGISTDG